MYGVVIVVDLMGVWNIVVGVVGLIKDGIIEFINLLWII